MSAGGQDKRNLFTWILDNQNLTIIIVFSFLFLLALIAPPGGSGGVMGCGGGVMGCGGGGGPAGSGNKGGSGNDGGDAVYSDTIR